MTMRWKTRQSLVESLVFAGATGVVAFILAVAGMLVDSRRGAMDRAAVSSLAKRPIASVVSGLPSPDHSRIYRIGGKGRTLFGLVLPMRSSKGGALAAALFSPDGELEAMRVIGSSSNFAKGGRDRWEEIFIGFGGSASYFDSWEGRGGIEALSGSTESFLAAAASLEKASESVRLAARGNP